MQEYSDVLLDDLPNELDSSVAMAKLSLAM